MHGSKKVTVSPSANTQGEKQNQNKSQNAHTLSQGAALAIVPAVVLRGSIIEPRKKKAVPKTSGLAPTT